MPYTNFAKNLVYLRKKKGLKQADIAEAIGLHQTVISSYECSSMPSAENAVKIANYFDVSVNDMISSDLGAGKEEY